jgi:hypothetical protein
LLMKNYYKVKNLIIFQNRRYSEENIF